MTNVVDQSAWWNPEIFTWVDGAATYITND